MIRCDDLLASSAFLIILTLMSVHRVFKIRNILQGNSNKTEQLGPREAWSGAASFYIKSSIAKTKVFCNFERRWLRKAEDQN